VVCPKILEDGVARVVVKQDLKLQRWGILGRSFISFTSIWAS